MPCPASPSGGIAVLSTARLRAQGEMELLESDFASRLTEHEVGYLQQRNSIPGFLSAVTMRLLDSAS